MTKTMKAYVCDNDKTAAQARGQLIAEGFKIALEDNFAYLNVDDKAYNNGSSSLFYRDKWIVVGARLIVEAPA